jgi:hypothetical protein
MLKTIGYILFLICCVSFLSILIIPFLGISAKQVAGVTVILIIIGEITFYTSLIFLGKTFYTKIKNILKFRKSALSKSNITGQPEEKETTAKS